MQESVVQSLELCNECIRKLRPHADGMGHIIVRLRPEQQHHVSQSSSSFATGALGATSYTYSNGGEWDPRNIALDDGNQVASTIESPDHTSESFVLGALNNNHSHRDLNIDERLMRGNTARDLNHRRLSSNTIHLMKRHNGFGYGNNSSHRNGGDNQKSQENNNNNNNNNNNDRYSFRDYNSRDITEMKNMIVSDSPAPQVESEIAKQNRPSSVLLKSKSIVVTNNDSRDTRVVPQSSGKEQGTVLVKVVPVPTYPNIVIRSPSIGSLAQKVANHLRANMRSHPSTIFRRRKYNADDFNRIRHLPPIPPQPPTKRPPSMRKNPYQKHQAAMSRSRFEMAPSAFDRDTAYFTIPVGTSSYTNAREPILSHPTSLPQTMYPTTPTTTYCTNGVVTNNDYSHLYGTAPAYNQTYPSFVYQ